MVEGQKAGKSDGKGSVSVGGQSKERDEGRGKAAGKAVPIGGGKRARKEQVAGEEGENVDREQDASAEDRTTAPVELPPLPRKWLVGRLAKLEQCVERLPADDPRAAVAEQRLQKVKGQVRMAGGRTAKRLFFSLAGGIDRIEKAERAVVEAESKVDRVRQELEEAEQERDEAAAQLDKERNLHAYRSFEGAADAAQAIGGFESIRQAMQTMGDLLARTGEGEQEWLDVANFLNRFGKQGSYAASEDSEVKDLWSESNATQEEDEAAERIGDEEGAQLVAQEAGAVRWAFSPSRTGAVPASAKEGLEGVRQEARLAVQKFGMPSEAVGGAPSSKQELAAPAEEAQTSQEPRLAIMDAVDHPIPSSGESGAELEPCKKRRGREVQVAGGSTAEDISMASQAREAAGEKEGEDL